MKVFYHTNAEYRHTHVYGDTFCIQRNAALHSGQSVGTVVAHFLLLRLLLRLLLLLLLLLVLSETSRMTKRNAKNELYA